MAPGAGPGSVRRSDHRTSEFRSKMSNPLLAATSICTRTPVNVTWTVYSYFRFQTQLREMQRHGKQTNQVMRKAKSGYPISRERKYMAQEPTCTRNDLITLVALILSLTVSGELC